VENDIIETSLESSEDYQIHRILLESESVCSNHKIYDETSQ